MADQADGDNARMLSGAGQLASGRPGARVKTGQLASGRAGALLKAGALFEEADRFLDGESETLAACRRAITRARDGCATILVAGLRSTGKSSLVSALWGDSELLPTAVRDCTQTNTLIRTPREGELDRRLILNFLTRDGSEEFASRGLAFHRLREVIAVTLGPTGPRLDERTPGERVRLAVETVRRLFAEHGDVHVLHEPATEQLEQLEQFIAHLGSPEYVPGGRLEKDWAERREYLMGRRRRDGRTLETGKLLSLQLVELVRATDAFGASPPRVIDTPWVPTFHNARRADLVLREAERADIIVITALPEPFELEPWVHEVFKMRPGLRARTLVVFNQVDTVDTSRLFGRGGFAEAWATNVERLGREEIPSGNLYACCARLPFLEGLETGSARDPLDAEREGRLRAVLGKIRAFAASSDDPTGRAVDASPDLFRTRLLAACDPADCGVESLRSRLVALAEHEVKLDRACEACEAIAAVDEIKLAPGCAGAWSRIRSNASALLRRLRAAAPEATDARDRGPLLPDGRALFK